MCSWYGNYNFPSIGETGNQGKEFTEDSITHSVCEARILDFLPRPNPSNEEGVIETRRSAKNIFVKQEEKSVDLSF